MVLAVDAGHHMNKAKVTFYMLLTIIGGAVSVHKHGNGKISSRVSMVLLETRGGQILQFVDADTGKRVALDAFAANLPTDRSTHQRSNGLWFVDESSLPTFSVEEVKSGFAANENLVIRGEKIDEKGHKIVYSHEKHHSIKLMML